MTDSQQQPLSDFVLRCTVERVDDSAFPGVPADESTAVMRIAEVLHAPEVFAAIGGQEITVQLVEPGSVAAGTDLILFANGWLYGEGLALVEVSHQPAPAEVQAMARDLSSARDSRADQQLRDRLLRADVVVSGRVADVRMPQPQAMLAGADPAVAGPISEHDPQWREAVISVDNTIKGEPAEETSVLFPASLDIAWALAPKLSAGQEGVFLLHRDVEVQPRLAALAPDVHAALSALDVLEVDSAERVQRLLDEPTQ